MNMNKLEPDTSFLGRLKNKLSRFIHKDKGQNPVNTIHPYTVSEIKDIHFYRADDISESRLNLVVPSIEEEHIYGGISTALRLFEEIAKSFKRIRIIVLDFDVSEVSVKRYPKYSLVSGEENSCDSLQIVSLLRDHVAEEPYNLAIAKQDIFIATIWYSAYLVKKIRGWQSRTYLSRPQYFIYLVQDYEPGFYPWSSQSLLAESTYQHSSETITVFNTKILQDFFHRKNIHFEKEYVLKPRLHKFLTEARSRFLGDRKQKVIVIYGRPETPRNAFCLIVESLRCWAQIDPSADGWAVISAGEEHETISLSENLDILSVGKLSIEAYAELLGSAAIGISFMISPHPSYPPLEMAHYGMKVITNAYENKDLSTLHDNITSLDDMRYETVARELSKLCRQIEANPFCGWEGESHIEEYLLGKNAFSFKESLVSDLSLLELNNSYSNDDT